MRTRWILEMQYPEGGQDSLLTTDRFKDFSDVERKVKQNREMIFVVTTPSAPLPEDMLMLDVLKRSGLKIELVQS